MARFISIIIPNHNGEATLKSCLEAAFASGYPKFEVIVVDDCSKDRSTAIIEQFPCRLIRLENHSGASKARNIGAENSKGEVLFFIDADCVLNKNTLAIAGNIAEKTDPRTVLGGTYTPLPFDGNFFSIFQSVFIHYSETKHARNPDYIATHAMIISTETFRKSGGFAENFLPILEDVEFSHRLRRMGFTLEMHPAILVRHIFNYSLARSFQNAIRKSRYWTAYSLKNNDLLADSGTASVELKTNVVSMVLFCLLFILWGTTKSSLYGYAILPVFGGNILINRRLLQAFFKTKGLFFGILASCYYTTLYPLAVGVGAALGAIGYVTGKLK